MTLINLEKHIILDESGHITATRYRLELWPFVLALVKSRNNRGGISWEFMFD
jgi:hypothetical protein